MFLIHSKIARLPVAVSSREVHGFIIRCSELWQCQHGLKAEGQ
jgi:hypothetical protein